MRDRGLRGSVESMEFRGFEFGVAEDVDWEGGLYEDYGE